jgi:hypothetical protein
MSVSKVSQAVVFYAMLRQRRQCRLAFRIRLSRVALGVRNMRFRAYKVRELYSGVYVGLSSSLYNLQKGLRQWGNPSHPTTMTQTHFLALGSVKAALDSLTIR